MKPDLKNIGVFLTIGTMLVGGIASGAILKKNVEESKEKIEKISDAQIQYAVQQGKVEEKLENLEEQNKELKNELKETLKEQQTILLEAIKAKKR